MPVHAESTKQLLTPGDRFLNPRETAELLVVSTHTLNYWRVRGDGPRFHKWGRHVRYLLSDITAWATERVVESDKIRA